MTYIRTKSDSLESKLNTRINGLFSDYKRGIIKLSTLIAELQRIHSEITLSEFKRIIESR